ncbi:MAG: hypothetical protein BGO77_01665 [Caedibacter sp. 37-49]|nr:MAG: hypothetical protein BGO77_01665 [Caedibacter sp. 37-49]
MKKYLLITTALLSLASLSYATDDQAEPRPSQNSPLKSASNEEVKSILQKYAPDNLERGAFNDLKTKDTANVRGRQYRIPLSGDIEVDKTLIQKFRQDLPLSLPTNQLRTLSVESTDYDLTSMKVQIMYAYFGAWHLREEKKYYFIVETNLEAPDYVRLTSLIRPQDVINSSESSSSQSSPKLSPSASSDSLSTVYNSDDEMEKLQAMISKLEEENEQLRQSSLEASSAASPADEFAPPPPPLMAPPPPPPAPGIGKISAAKQKVVILSPEYQPTYDALDEGVKEKVSTWKQARIEFYLKVLTEKGGEHPVTFLNLTDEQAQKVLKMPSYATQIAYLSLSLEDRAKKDAEEAEKAQRALQDASKQGDMLQELLKKRSPVAHYEPQAEKKEESKTIDASAASFAQALKIAPLAKEIQAFENAKKLWESVKQERKQQVLAFFPNDIILKGILLKTINGEIVALDSKKQGQYTTENLLRSGSSLLKQQKQISEELRFKAHDIRDLLVYSLLNAKAVGINASQIKPTIEALRNYTL